MPIGQLLSDLVYFDSERINVIKKYKLYTLRIQTVHF